MVEGMLVNSAVRQTSRNWSLIASHSPRIATAGGSIHSHGNCSDGTECTILTMRIIIKPLYGNKKVGGPMYSVVSAVADHSTWSEHLLYDPELHRLRMRGSQNVIPSILTSYARTYGRRLLSLSTTNRDDAVSTSSR